MPDFRVPRSPAAQPDPTPTAAEVDSSDTSLFGHSDTWVPGVSVAAIWLATPASALLSPDLVTGSQQEHFPLVGALDWLMLRRARSEDILVGALRIVTIVSAGA